VCSCHAGFEGKFCKHLFFVLKNCSDDRFSTMMLPTNQRGKETLFYIATGKKMSHAERAWFAPLEQGAAHTVNNESNHCSFQFSSGQNVATKCSESMALTNKSEIFHFLVKKL